MKLLQFLTKIHTGSASFVRRPPGRRFRRQRRASRATVLLGLVASLTIAVAGLPSNPAEAAGPFVYPVDGQTLDFEGDYLFKAASIPGATGYLIGLFQNGQLQVENWRDFGSLAQDFGIRRGNPNRTRLLPNVPTTVTVRGMVNGNWTSMSQITIKLVPRRAQVKVLELRFFPLDANGNLDAAETGICCPSLLEIRTQVDQLSVGTEKALENASRPAVDLSPEAYLDYMRLSSEEVLDKVPRSSSFTPFADHLAILNQRNICDWVDNRGIRDVWIWMYHTGAVAPIESNMSMGTRSSAFFNHGSYGDISNSFQQNDLPICRHTYVVYDFNYGRGVAEAVHDYGHQRERLFDWADSTMFNRFVNPYGPSGAGARACGNVHNPSNSTHEYDYANAAPVSSNCRDWHPDGSGTVTSIDCGAWGCSGDPQLQYLIWWSKQAPGRGGTLTSGGVRLRNWHELLADFDVAAALGRRLTE